MKSREKLCLFWLLSVGLVLCLAASGCTPGSASIPTPVLATRTPSPPPVTPTASHRPVSPIPTATPTLLPRPDGGHISYPSFEPLPRPTEDRPDEFELALAEYNRVRAEAEKTLDPELLRQVCVDPYLSEKMARIRTNKEDGSHWETPSNTFFIEATSWVSKDEAWVLVGKVETKLFFPRNASLPDDESCTGTIYSYRDCTYSVNYKLVRQDDRWYVSEANPVGECSSLCQQGRPAATVTAAPSISPSLSPTLSFPSVATIPSGWPALPADLYFRRGGQLWRWPASGGDLQQASTLGGAVGQEVVSYGFAVEDKYLAYQNDAGQLYILDREKGTRVFPPAGTTPPAVHFYQFSSDGATLLYLTAENEIHLFDLSTGEGEDIAVTGYPRQVALTADNRYVVYLSSALPVDLAYPEEPFQAVLMAVDRWNSNKLYQLGACGTPEDRPVHMGCAGFLLFPDENKLVLTDDRGLWLVDVPVGDSHLYKEQSFMDGGESSYAVRTPLAWVPGTRQLLLRYTAHLGSILAVWNPATDWEQMLPATGCYVDCHVEWAWARDGLWVSPIPGTMYLAQVSPEGYITITYSSVDTRERGLWPTQLKSLPDGRVAFVQQRCSQDLTSLSQEPGVFVLETRGAVRFVSPLPAFGCVPGRYRESSIYGGTAVWSLDGDAYLYLDGAGNPLLLGLTDGSALWDVRELFAGASDFRWAVNWEARSN